MRNTAVCIVLGFGFSLSSRELQGYFIGIGTIIWNDRLAQRQWNTIKFAIDVTTTKPNTFVYIFGGVIYLTTIPTKCGSLIHRRILAIPALHWGHEFAITFTMNHGICTLLWPHFNPCQSKTSLKLEHGWVIISLWTIICMFTDPCPNG